MLEYVVRLAWRAEFTFDDGQTALTFAQLAANRRSCEEEDDIIITIRRKEEVKEEPDDV